MADITSMATGIAQQYTDAAAAQNVMLKAASDAELATLDGKAVLANSQAVSSIFDLTSQAVSR
jgi:hypothetical protein